MTIRELINELSQIDDDLMDYQVWVTVHTKLTHDCRLSLRVPVRNVPENFDIREERVYLEAL